MIAAACGGGHSPIHVSSSAFAAGATIPRPYTCDGADISPPLHWSGVPPQSRELRLLMRDPDAPGGNFIHWSVSGIAATTSGLAAGERPAGAVEGRNSFGTLGYRGPCPPSGEKAHHYVITVTAVSGGSTLASGSLTGTYARS